MKKQWGGGPPTPALFSALLLFLAVVCRARQLNSFLFKALRTLCEKLPGCTQTISLPRRLSLRGHSGTVFFAFASFPLSAVLPLVALQPRLRSRVSGGFSWIVPYSLPSSAVSSAFPLSACSASFRP